jgi:transposase-like protein
MTRPAPWTHEQVRAWVERHGGNISALARELGVRRQSLQAWMADPATTSSARPPSPMAQRLMEALDALAGRP